MAPNPRAVHVIGHLSIDWLPLVPWPLVAILSTIALVLAAFALWRRAPGVWWRALVLTTLLLALANPTLVREDREALSDVALLVVDRSPSQSIADRSVQTDAAVAGLIERLNQLPNTETRIVEAGTDAFTGRQEGTQLFSAVRQALANLPRGRVGGLVVVSDGQVHDVPEALDSLGLDAPVHLLLTGSENEGDRRLTVTRAPSFGIVGRSLTLSFQVDDLPESTLGDTAQVTLRQDGGEARVITVPVGREHEVEFELIRRGLSVLELEVEPGAQELTELNNRVAVEINGVRDRLRVLLVSGEPHSGERAWRNILKSDPAVDLVHFTILRPPEKQDGTPIRELSLIAFPTRELFEVKLEEFDLIIFDRYRRRGVLPSIYLDNIARYVEAGGALLEAVGPTFATPLSLYRTPLGRVLPGEPNGFVYEQGYRPAITEVGERHPVTAELPGAAGRDGHPTWGRWFRQVDVDAASGVTVMDGVDGRPLLILDRVGEGRVAQVLSDHMWLWSRGFEGGGPQADLLRRVAHWLMKEPDLEEEDLRARVEGGALEVVRRSLSPELPVVKVTRPDGEIEEVDLEPAGAGRASGRLPVEQSGLYRIDDGELSTLAAVGPLNPLEFTDLRSTSEPMDPLVTASGGAAIRLAQSDLPDMRKVKSGRDRHGRNWIGIQANGAYLVTGISQAPVLANVLILLLALIGALAAWLREGR